MLTPPAHPGFEGPQGTPATDEISVQPLFHVPGHDDIENLFAVRDRWIHNFRITGVRYSLLHRAMQGADDFQKMLIELFCVRCGFRHKTSHRSNVATALERIGDLEPQAQENRI